MEVIINGAEINFSEYNFNDLNELFDTIKNNNYIIIEVIADGVDITNLNNDKIEELRPISKIIIKVKSKKVLVKESIKEAENYLPRLTSGIDIIINKFNQGEEMVAYEMLSDGIEGFQWINLFINNLINTHHISHNLKSDFKNWQDIFPEFLTALENEDIVLVTDLLEYEIKPMLKKFKKSINSITIND